MPPSPNRQLLRLAGPMYVAQLAIMASGLIDTVMAGRLSALDLAAVGVASSILATVQMSLLSVLLALPPLGAHLRGAGRDAEIGRELRQALWLALDLAAIAMLILAHPGPAVAFAELQPAVAAKVRDYLTASVWAVPGMVAMRLFYGLLNGLGRPRPVMVFNLVALALKVPLNAVFLYGLLGTPALGGPGCAVASALSYGLTALLAWGWCLAHPGFAAYGLHVRPAPPDGRALGEFLKLGLPIALTFIADLTAFFMALFIARLGFAASAAHQIAASLAVLAYMLPLALGNAAAVLAGQALGAGEAGRARALCWRAVRLGLGFALAVALLLWAGAGHVAALYTSDAAVRSLAAPLVALVGLYHVADALQAVAVNALRGYRKTAASMLIYTSCLWGVGLGGGYLLGLSGHFGPPRGASGFWIAAIMGLGIAAAGVTAYLARVSRVPAIRQSALAETHGAARL